MTKDDPLICQEDRVHVDLGMVYLLPDVELNLFVRSEKLDNVRRGLAHKINLGSVSIVIAGKALPSSILAKDLGNVAGFLQDSPLSEGLLDRGIRRYGPADCKLGSLPVSGYHCYIVPN